MSRHTLQPRADRPDVAEAAIGWDRPLATFFFQAFATADGDGEDRVLEWRGTAPGELPTPEAAIAVAAGYAEIPEHMAATLDADRAATADQVDSPWQTRLKQRLFGPLRLRDDGHRRAKGAGDEGACAPARPRAGERSG